ncbi:thioredoxin family protein [Longirhabdus pacifica]|uniref:thioredoxin family protein n=1 Tax=Longirhabdus pacifica TaxID=2305227 RepID=UPI001008BDBF|nr:thioredoxin family protein [Longirhabdus pacifica]
MARTPSNMMPLGTKAPDFVLPDVTTNSKKSLGNLAGNNATVVMFICNHCPFVIHVVDEIVRLAEHYMDKGISFIAISSNDVIAYPEDAPDKMKEFAIKNKFPFSYLYDETQEVAKAYDAACTPDFYIFDGELDCVYRGQLDDSRPDSGIPVTGKDIREALNLMLEGKPVFKEQKASLGCNIKWKA